MYLEHGEILARRYPFEGARKWNLNDSTSRTHRKDFIRDAGGLSTELHRRGKDPCFSLPSPFRVLLPPGGFQLGGFASITLVLNLSEGGPSPEASFQLRLEPPAGVLVTQKYILSHALQPIISFSSIPTLILPFHDIPQSAYDNDVPNEVTQSLTKEELSTLLE